MKSSEYFASRMKELGITTMSLARMSCVAESTIIRLLKANIGSDTFPKQTLDRIMGALKQTDADFLAATGECIQEYYSVDVNKSQHKSPTNICRGRVAFLFNHMPSGMSIPEFAAKAAMWNDTAKNLFDPKHANMRIKRMTMIKALDCLGLNEDDMLRESGLRIIDFLPDDYKTLKEKQAEERLAKKHTSRAVVEAVPERTQYIACMDAYTAPVVGIVSNKATQINLIKSLKAYSERNECLERLLVQAEKQHSEEVTKAGAELTATTKNALIRIMVAEKRVSDTRALIAVIQNRTASLTVSQVAAQIAD